MAKYLLTVDYHGGVVDTPMTEWAPEDIQAHMDYYRALNRELAARGELVEVHALTGPEQAVVVTSDGATAPVVTDGPFAEFKEMLAGYELVDVGNSSTRCAGTKPGGAGRRWPPPGSRRPPSRQSGTTGTTRCYCCSCAATRPSLPRRRSH